LKRSKWRLEGCRNRALIQIGGFTETHLITVTTHRDMLDHTMQQCENIQRLRWLIARVAPVRSSRGFDSFGSTDYATGAAVPTRALSL
jgi:hypothetical protein